MGRDTNYFVVARRIYVSDSHTKFSWIASIGLGGNSFCLFDFIICVLSTIF